MVIPRSRSSGALSIWSKAVYLLAALKVASTLVIAAVRVVLPWSIWPMVPTLTCGFVRSNFFFAIYVPFPLQNSAQCKHMCVRGCTLAMALKLIQSFHPHPSLWMDITSKDTICPVGLCPDFGFELMWAHYYTSTNSEGISCS